VFQRIQVFWDVVLCPWVRVSVVSKTLYFYERRDHKPLTQRHIPDDLNPLEVNLLKKTVLR